MGTQFVKIGTILVLIAISLTGCITPDEITADEIIAKMLQTNDEITFYSFESSKDSTQVWSLFSFETNSTGTNVTRINYIENGDVDILNNKLKITSVAEGNTSVNQNNSIVNTSDIEFQSFVYLVDNVCYTGYESDGITTWSHYDTGRDSSVNQTWVSYSILELQKWFINNEFYPFTNYSLERQTDEQTGGVDCYKLTITTVYDNDSVKQGTKFFELQNQYWISKNTFQLQKLISMSRQENMGMVQNINQQISETVFRITAVLSDPITEMKQEVFFNNYNQPITIEVPSEALQEP